MGKYGVHEMSKSYHRAEILRACKELLYRSPAATSDEIAAFAGYSKRTVYRYYASKESILREIRSESLHCFHDFTKKAQIPSLPAFADALHEFRDRFPAEYHFLSGIDFSLKADETGFYFPDCMEILVSCFAGQYAVELALLFWRDLLFCANNGIPESLPISVFEDASTGKNVSRETSLGSRM